jgi:hypothetical protein
MPTISSVGPIAINPAGALDGDGTVCHSLSVKVDNETVFINPDNELVSPPITINAGSGLKGDGTAANPLGVNVDGKTMLVNSSNQLVAAPQVGIILTQTATLTAPDLAGLLAPIEILPAVAGRLYLPILWLTVVTKTSTGAWGPAKFRLIYTGAPNVTGILDDLPTGLNVATAGSAGAIAGGANGNWNPTTPNLIGRGVALTIDQAFTASPPPVTVNFIIAYYIYQP